MKFMQSLFQVILGSAVRYGMPYLVTVGIIGFCIYMAGTVQNWVAAYRISHGQAVSWPYRSITFSFHASGFILMALVSVGLYFFGAYEPFFDLLRGL